MKFEYVAQTNVCTNISIFAQSIANTLTRTWFNYCFVIQALSLKLLDFFSRL